MFTPSASHVSRDTMATDSLDTPLIVPPVYAYAHIRIYVFTQLRNSAPRPIFMRKNQHALDSPRVLSQEGWDSDFAGHVKNNYLNFTWVTSLKSSYRGCSGSTPGVCLLSTVIARMFMLSLLGSVIVFAPAGSGISYLYK